MLFIGGESPGQSPQSVTPVSPHIVYHLPQQQEVFYRASNWMPGMFASTGGASDPACDPGKLSLPVPRRELLPVPQTAYFSPRTKDRLIQRLTRLEHMVATMQQEIRDTIVHVGAVSCHPSDLLWDYC